MGNLAHTFANEKLTHYQIALNIKKIISNKRRIPHSPKPGLQWANNGLKVSELFLSSWRCIYVPLDLWDLSVYLSISLSVTSLCLCLCLCLSLCLSLCLYLSLTFALPVSLFFRSICLFSSPSLPLSVYLSICLSVCFLSLTSVSPSDTFKIHMTAITPAKTKIRAKHNTCYA